MEIDKEKCQAYHDMLLAIVHMTSELSDDEYNYIMAMFYIKIDKQTMKKLEKREKLKNDN